MGKIKEEDVFNQNQGNATQSEPNVEQTEGFKKEDKKVAEKFYTYTITNKTGRNIDLVARIEDTKTEVEIDKKRVKLKRVKLIKSLGRGKKEIKITTKEKCFIFRGERFKDKVTFVES